MVSMQIIISLIDALVLAKSNGQPKIEKFYNEFINFFHDKNNIEKMNTRNLGIFLRLIKFVKRWKSCQKWEARRENLMIKL